MSNKALSNSGEQLVQFRKRDAQRISDAVLAHESARRGRTPSALPRAFSGGGGAIEEVTYEGAWPEGTIKQVAYAYDTTNTSTASALNFLCSILPGPSSPGRRRALIASVGTTMVLVNAQC